MRFSKLALLLGISFSPLGCGSETEDDGPTDVITGMVTVDGKPANYTMIVFKSEDGQDKTGPKLPDGSYEVKGAPHGKLKVMFTGMPPRPGKPVSGAVGNIPAKYTSAKSDLTFEFEGGKVTQDFDLKR